MLSVENSTPKNLELIAAFPRKRLVKLNLKSRWNNDHFEQVFFCHRQLPPAAKKWCVPVDALRDLTFDSGTPDARATRLQQLISAFENSQKKKGGEQ